MASQTYKQISVLSASTFAFTICFAVWVMFSIIGIPIKETLGLNETEFGLLAATPVLTGSLIRLPLGMLTDKYGGRPVRQAQIKCDACAHYMRHCSDLMRLSLSHGIRSNAYRSLAVVFVKGV